METRRIAERVWPGRDPHVEELGGGITNRNFKVTVDGNAYVLRIAGKDTELLGIDRDAERAATLAAAAAGVAPEVVAAALADGDRESQLRAAVELLRHRFAQPPASDRERDRALGVLVRKGYAADVAHEAIRAFERDG